MITVVLLVAVLAVLVGVGATLLVVRRRTGVVDTVDPAEAQAEMLNQAVQSALATIQLQAARERDTAVQAALTQAAVLGREQLGAQSAAVTADLAAKKDVIDSRLGQMQSEVRTDLDRLTRLVGQLGDATAERFGQVDQSLRAHAEITQHLSSTTQGLREALASPNSR